MSRVLLLWVVSLLMFQCNNSPRTLFNLLPSDKTGVRFSNVIEETDSFNILTYEYIYNGGGVAIADFNQDGKPDLFFSGNEVGNKIYLNQGKFSFRDITESAGVNVAGRWNSGVAVADVNQDGWPDIYVCATMKKDPDSRRNMLFVNQGLNVDGIPTFIEHAASYGVDDRGYSVSAAFFDYDRDGDLDLYVLTNEKLNNLPTNYRPKITDGSSPNNDRLYRNNGDNTFTNVTKESGIIIEGFGLGLAIADFNVDGWPDIYVSNDYLSNDLLYINNRNGTFSNQIARYIGHQSLFSMGNDAADINNDALPDIVTLDMLPEINRRKKSTISNKNYQTYQNTEKFGYEYQYVRNMLHINNGLDRGIKFSEVGQMAGIYQTEWSWSPLMADFDNDGDKDLLITNGFPKDITDKDFANYRADLGNVAGIRYMVDSIPIVKIPNYAYRNDGDLNFSDVTGKWGLYRPSFSNGAAFVDLDNDGDLDYVVNNINDEAFVYENKLYDEGVSRQGLDNFIRFKLVGEGQNKDALGAKIILHYGSGKIQSSEQAVYRGFLSSVEAVPHFGLGKATLVDSVFVVWPDGQTQLIRNVKANQVLTVDKRDKNNLAVANPDFLFAKKSSNRIFEPANKQSKIQFKHQEEDIVDYNFQRTLPHKFSQAGPGIAVGDINGDGLEDFILGGSASHNTQVFTQQKDGAFAQSEIHERAKAQEDEGLLLFDADNDKDLDLYIVSGSIEPGQSFDIFQDRFFLNNGRGQFTPGTALPDTKASGSCVRAADFDADGDLDLFVGGRVVPGSYPLSPESYILRNENGKFSDATTEVCAELKKPGMVTDALWSDFNGDGQIDLILVGEFMPVTFFKNEKGKLTKLSTTGVETQKGWWNSIAPGDFDNDGDIDYVAGNLGLNNNYQVSNKYPMWVYAKDFDNNGSIDPIIACYQKESLDTDIRKLYPVHFWDELNQQSPKFRKKFATYKKYGQTTMDQFFTKDELEGVVIMEANHMESSYIENLGNGTFSIKSLPRGVQIAPVNGMVSDDFDGDGNLDVLMVGNDYSNEVFAGRFDAFTGLVLLGNGKGGFRILSSAESGFYTNGDAKGLAKVTRGKDDLFLASQNRDSIKVFSKMRGANDLLISPQQLDISVDWISENGVKKHVELYHGSGYLSQSGRKLRIPRGTEEIIFHDSRGATRSVKPPL